MRNSPRVTAPFHQPAAQPRQQVRVISQIDSDQAKAWGCGAVAAALQPPHPLGGARWVENNVVTSALPLNGLEMNSCAVDGLVVASGVPRYQ